jgi:rare lipoprotein A (peptidoglycan hydrolase)
MLAQATADLERHRRTLAKTSQQMRDAATNALEDLAHARDDAVKAGAKVGSLQKQQEALAAAFGVSNSTMQALGNAQRGLDQRDLLALLGPTGGAGCDLSSGLRDTGERITGISSWYGWELAGHPTATGAIFDPRLFTAANKELPLNSFLRVHFNGTCAVVLVNDRGPYITGRVFDLSQAAAEYLGVGLNEVTADVLIPTA